MSRIVFPIPSKQQIEAAESRGVNLPLELGYLLNQIVSNEINGNNNDSNTIRFQFNKKDAERLKKVGIDLPSHIAYAYLNEIKNNRN